MEALQTIFYILVLWGWYCAYMWVIGKFLVEFSKPKGEQSMGWNVIRFSILTFFFISTSYLVSCF